MVRAFVTVKTAAGRSTDLRDRVAGIDEVEEAHVVAGEYDLITEAVGEEVYTLMDTVVTRLRDLDGVVDTRTYICLD